MTDATEPPPPPPPEPADAATSARHFALGWLGLAAFALLGLVLEALHGFKVGWYLDVGNETRHLLLRLGHAHGTLLSLVQVAFAVTVRAYPRMARRGFASACLTAGWLLVPAGFLLGGAFLLGNDPGVGIFAVPVGALLTILGMASIGLAVGARRA